MVDASDLESKLTELQNWFEENPKLPEQIHPLYLKRFLKCMYGDVEEAKKLIELNYAMRNKHAHIFINRDPEDERVQNLRKACDMVALPGLTPENYKMIFFRILDMEPRHMNSLIEAQTFFMIADCRFTMPDCEEYNEKDASLDNMASGEIQIVDIGNYTMSHVARISFLTLRIYMKFLQEAYPLRLKAMHIINCPSYLDKMIAVVRPFIRDDVYNMIHFHKNGLETLYEHVPRDLLPEEYGGKAGTLPEIKAIWTEALKEKRDYLLDPKQWKVEPTEGQGRWWWWSK